jgi:hypothetical protein
MLKEEKNGLYTIQINEKRIEISVLKNKNKLVTYIDDMELKDTKELYYFINSLSDLAELLREKEEKLNVGD